MQYETLLAKVTVGSLPTAPRPIVSHAKVLRCCSRGLQSMSPTFVAGNAGNLRRELLKDSLPLPASTAGTMKSQCSNSSPSMAAQEVLCRIAQPSELLEEGARGQVLPQHYLSSSQLWPWRACLKRSTSRMCRNLQILPTTKFHDGTLLYTEVTQPEVMCLRTRLQR